MSAKQLVFYPSHGALHLSIISCVSQTNVSVTWLLLLLLKISSFTDKNECLAGDATCTADRCRNTVGSYTCVQCLPGFIESKYGHCVGEYVKVRSGNHQCTLIYLSVIRTLNEFIFSTVFCFGVVRENIKPDPFPMAPN